MPCLVWFRSDLRVRDNPALVAAAKRRDGVLGLFILTPEQWAAHDWSPWKVDLLLRSLHELSRELGRRGIPLLIRSVSTFDQCASIVLDVMREHSCNALFLNREYELSERRRDEGVRRVVEAMGANVSAFHDQVLVPPQRLNTKQGGVYTIFTPFFRAWLTAISERGVPTGLHAPRAVGPPVVGEPVPVGIEGFGPPPQPGLWQAGEVVAARALSGFARRAMADYDRQRDRLDLPGTSVLSHHLNLGVVSFASCVRAAVAAEGGLLDPGTKPVSGAGVWLSELAWREFYRHLIARVDRLSMHQPFRLSTRSVPWRDDPGGLEAWKRGETGYPIVDAAMRQLAATGWMHNRARMIAAMFLTKHLLIDWRLGERHFMTHLVDGDLASNNGGWQWAASTGTDAAPYFRIFNPASQAAKCDPEGAYVARWVPELAGLPPRLLHDASRIPPLERSRRAYPGPVVEHSAARERAIRAFRRAMAT